MYRNMLRKKINLIIELFLFSYNSQRFSEDFIDLLLKI